MKERTIKALIVEPGKHPRVITLLNELNALQRAVSIGAESQGLIELFEIEDGVCILCNEEGKLLGLEGNRKIGNDVIAGVFYVVGEDRRGNLISLPEVVLEGYRTRFWEPEFYTPDDIEKAMYMNFVGFW